MSQPTAVTLTEEFIEETRVRLMKLERALLARYLLVVVALLIGGGLFEVTQSRSSDVAAQNRHLIAEVNTNQKLIRLNQQRSIQALCSLRDDVHRRVVATKGFIAHHPSGIPGISVAVIHQNLADSEHTVAALSSLVCTER